jgi:hypothetical protein
MRTRLEEQVERAHEEREQLQSQLRSVAFREAGIDADNGIGKAVARTYDGPAEADAIRAFAAEEYGIGAADDNNEEPDSE